jgi:hypothetical protein
MVHPPCYPDLAPNDLWLFIKIKSALKERIFQDNESIKKKDVMMTPKAIPQKSSKNVSNIGNIIGLNA